MRSEVTITKNSVFFFLWQLNFTTPRDMSLVARFANYRSWLPLILLFAGLTVFHIHLENYYSNVVSNINSTTPLNAGPRMPKPVYEDPSVAARRKAATAEGVAAKIAEEEEGMRNGEPYVEGKPWLSKRHLMHYPENA